MWPGWMALPMLVYTDPWTSGALGLVIMVVCGVLLP